MMTNTAKSTTLLSLIIVETKQIQLALFTLPTTRVNRFWVTLEVTEIRYASISHTECVLLH